MQRAAIKERKLLPIDLKDFFFFYISKQEKNVCSYFFLYFGLVETGTGGYDGFVVVTV